MIIAKVAVKATGDDDNKSKSGSKKWIDNKSDDGSKDNNNQRLNLIRNLNVNTMHLNQSKFPRLYGCNSQFNLFFLINIRRKFNCDHDLISILFFVAHSKQFKNSIQFRSTSMLGLLFFSGFLQILLYFGPVIPGKYIYIYIYIYIYK